MRRPALFIAGLLLATGSGLALASPASAAVSGDTSRWHCHYSHGHFWDDWDDGRLNAHLNGDDNRRRWCHSHRHRDRDWYHDRGNGRGN